MQRLRILMIGGQKMEQIGTENQRYLTWRNQI